jgi:hypothetical protein
MTSNRFQEKSTMTEMKADNIDVFPQHRAGKRKPTIADIVNDGVKTGQMPEAILATIGTLYPKKTMGEIMAAFEAEIERQKTEAAQKLTELDRFKEIFALIESIRAELGDEDMAPDQALWIAAERGNEQAVAFWHDLAIAVELDPDWSVSEEGHAVCRKGGTYDSPEKLVAAYRAGRIDDPRPIKIVVEKICLQAFRTHGITLDNIDDVDDTTRQSVNARCVQIAQSHPRRKEIQDFFVDEEIVRQCRELGIQFIDDEEPTHDD